MKKLKLLTVILILSGYVTAQDNCNQTSTKYEHCDSICQKTISALFVPPQKYDGIYGQFRSPLIFYNGNRVQNISDWSKRREEILNQWHNMMGKWPHILTEQKLVFCDSVHRENFTQYRVRFNWLPKEATEGYLLVPDKKGIKPAVIVVYYEPETAIGNGKPNRDFAYQLAKRGYVTLSLGTSEASKQKIYSLYYPSEKDVQVQPLSMLAYAAANAWNVLAKVPDVDSTRIGIMGHSFGGKWAMFASCLYDKFSCAVWSDPGIVFDETKPNVNYWEPWYLGYHPKPWRERGIITLDNPAKGLYPYLVENSFDLTDLHALMAPRSFLVSGGAEDPPERWIPLNHTIAVNCLLGYKKRVAMSNRAKHSPNQFSNEQSYMFLDCFLKQSAIK